MESALPSAARPMSTVFSRLEGTGKRRVFVDPYEIAPLTCIRPLSHDGMMSILRQFNTSGWIATLGVILVVELKDQPYGSDTSPSVEHTRGKKPVYGCVDGWHRLKAILAVLERKDDAPFDAEFPMRPSGPFVLGRRPPPAHNITCLDTPRLFPLWPVDDVTGVVSHIEVSVLEGTFAMSTLVSFAMHMNSATGHAVVQTTYLDQLAAGMRFLAAKTTEYLANVKGGMTTAKFFPQTWFVEEMKGLYGTSAVEATTDFNITRLLNTNDGLMELLQELAVQYPSAAINAIQRDTLQHLVPLIPADGPDAAEIMTWTVSAFIKIQHAWGEIVQQRGNRHAKRQALDSPVPVPTGGPSKNRIVKAVLSLLIDIYILHKPQPSEPPVYPGSTPQKRLEMSAAVIMIARTFADSRGIAEQKQSLKSVRDDFFSSYAPPRPPTPPLSPETSKRILGLEADFQQDPDSPSFIPSPTRNDGEAIEPTQQQGSEAASASPDPSQQDSVTRTDEQAEIAATQQASKSDTGPPVPTTGGSGPADGHVYVPPLEQSPSAGTQQAADDEGITPHREETRVEPSDDEITPAKSASTRTAPASGNQKRHRNWPPPQGVEPRRTRMRTTMEEKRLKEGRAKVAQAIQDAIKETSTAYRDRAAVIPISQQGAAPTHAPGSSAVVVKSARRRVRRTPRKAGDKSPFDDDVEPLGDSARFLFMRDATTAEKKKMMQSIYVPAFIGGEELVRGFFAALEETARPEQCLADIRLWISSPGDTTTRVLRTLVHQGLADSGFVMLDGMVPEQSGAAGGDTLRQCVDGVLGHFTDCFSPSGPSMCCKNTANAVEAWTAIRNASDSSTKSLRFQSPRQAITQHLEKFHPETFAQKLLVDILIACIAEILAEHGGHSEYLMPKSGSRLLLTAPGCRAQCMHRDFDDRFDNTVPLPVDDPSYFVIVTGAEAAPLQVIPGSHKLVARMEHLLNRATQKESSAIEADAIGNMAVNTTVLIKPYSVFIGRGDLVHGGAGRSPTEKGPAARFHTYVMRKGKDRVEDHLFEYEF